MLNLAAGGENGRKRDLHGSPHWRRKTSIAGLGLGKGIFSEKGALSPT